MLPKTFHIDLPNDLANEILKCKTDEDVEKSGGRMATSSITRSEKKWCACTSLLYAGPADDGSECGEGALN